MVRAGADLIDGHRVADPRLTPSIAAMRRGPLILSVLLHGLLIGAGLAHASGERPLRIEVHYRPSAASEDRPKAMPPDPAPIPPVAEEKPEPPAPRTRALPWPRPETAKPETRSARRSLEESPDWLCRVVPLDPPRDPPKERPAERDPHIAEPKEPPKPEAAFVPAVPDETANEPPPYPLQSRRLGEQGRVVLSLAIDARGNVVEARIVRSSGHRRLDRAALEALRKWKFLPATRGGHPVATTIEQEVEFVLSGRSARG
ncbi:MAG: hypothetical protein Fur0037_26200 [Planctomycetota bacterium]